MHATHPLTPLPVLRSILVLAACAGLGSCLSEEELEGPPPPPPPPQTFVVWQNNDNEDGTVLLDRDGDRFAVLVDTRQVYDLDRQITIGNLVVPPNDPTLYLGVDPVGVLRLENRSAVLTTGTGFWLDIEWDGGSYQVRATNDSVGSGSGGGGSGGPPDPGYITFRDNANGEVVLDATNDQIRFRVSDRRMEFEGRLIDDVTLDSSAYLVNRGQRFGEVLLVPGDRGGRVAATMSLSGNLLDFYMEGNTLRSRELRVSLSNGSGGPTHSGEELQSVGTPLHEGGAKLIDSVSPVLSHATPDIQRQDLRDTSGSGQ